MGDEYYTLDNFHEVSDPREFEIDRMKDLFAAVKFQRDCTIIQLLKRDDRRVECLIIDIETDGVPPKNVANINYRERLALLIHENPKTLVEVWAIRKDFPTLIHQNQGLKDSPKKLCLYFEPPAAVLRTWTPQKFIRRVQWWLEKSATGDLHPADQRVEQLFFVSRFELVLPWNFDDIRKAPGYQLMIVHGPTRPDGGITCFLKAFSKDTQIKEKIRSIRHVEFTVKPILQGHIESDPTTLGELGQILAARGVDLLPDLNKVLCEGIGSDGVEEVTDDSATIILIHIPVCREKEGLPEDFYDRAFLVPTGPVKLGIATGAFFLDPTSVGSRKKYYRSSSLLHFEQAFEWRIQAVYAMEVLCENNTSMARNQSGISTEGPKAVLIGAGSIGSALCNLWGRSGWGHWTVIDNDHIKPHNLSRHTAYAENIGEPKTTVVAELHDAALHGASKVTPLVADACDISQELVRNALISAKLVIDASTTLEYPRAASNAEGVGRHMSVFITPGGNDAVLLAEDEGRSIRLRSLEAQYYRALIREAWGEHHLDGNLGSFWSGASCRDLSGIMPYSRVIGHAGILAEQIQMAADHPDALIRVWQRDPQRGSTVVHDLRPAQELCMKFGKFMLFMDTVIEEQLRSLRTAALPCETGGVLLGYYDFNISAVTIVTALSAPLDSKTSPGSFERGIAGLLDAVREASRRTAGIVGYIGEWHSHPPNYSTKPSDADLIQLFELARGMAEDGLPAVQLIVGDQDLQILQCTVKE